MKHIVVDLEMNPIKKQHKEERKICKNEIIEIGAVALDEDFKEIDSFKAYIKPQFNDVIERKIVRLTGITNEMVLNAPLFIDALLLFFEWCRNMNDDIIFYQWSDSDLLQIHKEMELKNITLSNENIMYIQKWEDVQKEYVEKLGLERQVSLSNALTFAGVDAVGNLHDALDDARNTGLLLEIARDDQKKQEILDKIFKILHPVEMRTALSELFDFNTLQLAN